MSNLVNLPSSLSINAILNSDEHAPYFSATVDDSNKINHTEGMITHVDNLEDHTVPNYMISSQIPGSVATASADDASPFDNNLITKFYVGSITVVGLYIFYRMLVKNK